MNFLHKTKPYIFLLLGIIISTLIWDHIKLPYDTNNEISAANTGTRLKKIEALAEPSAKTPLIQNK